ncbi:sodium- and chloride-dependent GABA transporter 1-like [Trichogramma pretiosum]|uniref:sodium- and chloride-dependent GABA transporter 1-like n=1 Tax=Trichogramma pretiosum TaxID=7493 RepID=UPI0006C99B4C|nr:sodium- and chloride-dependent GABA transporter 1-like [Trichogramma pretiosum]
MSFTTKRVERQMSEVHIRLIRKWYYDDDHKVDDDAESITSITSVDEYLEDELSTPWEFALKTTSYNVTVGNVCRFFYLAHRNGGGSFIIPYVVMMIFLGLPVFFLEILLGQYTKRGPIKIFARMAPAFKGLGLASLFVLTIINSYYMVLNSWSFYYSYKSIGRYGNPNWTHCDSPYNTEYCYSSLRALECQEGHLYYNRSCTPLMKICKGLKFTSYSTASKSCLDESGAAHPIRELTRRILSSEEFFNNYIAGIRGATWEHWGYVCPILFAIVTGGWMTCCFCLIHGYGTVGRIPRQNYLTSLMMIYGPFIMIIFVLLLAISWMPNGNGFAWFLTPDWKVLTSVGVWVDAASQVIFTLGLGCGTVFNRGSINPFKRNSYGDACWIVIVDIFVSILAGFSLSGVLGFLAYEMDVESNIGEIVNSSPGVAYVVLTEGLSRMWMPRFLSAGFFGMLCIFGFCNQFEGIQTLAVSVIDINPQFAYNKEYVYYIICVIGWLLTIPMLGGGGIYLFTLLEWSTSSMALLFIVFMELFVSGSLYSCNQLFENLSEMEMKFSPWIRTYLSLNWRFITPILSLVVLILQVLYYLPSSYGSYIFPDWTNYLSYFVSSLAISPILLGFIHQMMTGSASEENLFKPSVTWGSYKKAREVMLSVIQPAELRSLVSSSTSQALQLVERQDQELRSRRKKEKKVEFIELEDLKSKSTESEKSNEVIPTPGTSILSTISSQRKSEISNEVILTPGTSNLSRRSSQRKSEKTYEVMAITETSNLSRRSSKKKKI